MTIAATTTTTTITAIIRDIKKYATAGNTIAKRIIINKYLSHSDSFAIDDNSFRKLINLAIIP
jgi:hypothetical protein